MGEFQNICGNPHDTVEWTDDLKDQHVAWTAAFKTACENSPDEKIVDEDIATLIRETNTRRLASETSPPSDSFLSLLAILLPLFFVLYWMFLRRVYYSAEKKPANLRKPSLTKPVFRDIQ